MKTKLTFTLAALVATALPSTASTLLTGRANFDFNAMDGTLTGQGGSGTVNNTNARWYSSVNYNSSQVGVFGDGTLDFGAELVTGITSTTTTITSAYRFNGTGGDSNEKSMGEITGNGDLSWEFWLNPTGAGNNQVIYEDGGSGNGIAAWYNGTTNTLNFGISNQGVATASITSGDFSHVVMTYNSADSAMNIYVNTIAGTSAVGGVWNGGDQGGIGEVGNSSVTHIVGNEAAYVGDIAVIRFYDELLSTGDIATSYAQYAYVDVPEPSALSLLGLAGFALLLRRRRS